MATPSGSNLANGTPKNNSSSQIPPLGMTSTQFVTAAQIVISDIEKYYSTIADRPVVPSVSPGYLQPLLPATPPQEGEPFTSISADIERAIMPGITHWQHPKFMAFFPASTTYPSILAEMWSAALTAPAFNWICSPAVTELETIVLDWMAGILGLPDAFLSKGEGGGVIQGSASEATATCMIAARERWIKRQLAREGVRDDGSDETEDRSYELRSKLVALGADQTHSSIKKAAILAGTRYRSIPTKKEDGFKLTGPGLRAVLEELKEKGICPYSLTVTLGTTNTCAVDDIAALAEVRADYPDMWIHCDAAYAGAALVLPEYRELAALMVHVDTFNMDMHKWLLTNFDASCLFVQRRRDLTDALTVTPAYLRNEFSDSGVVTDYRDWQIPLGRRFRALKIWFVIRTFGVEGMKSVIHRHLEMGELVAELVRGRSDLFSLLTPPAFALTVLTVNPPVDLTSTRCQLDQASFNSSGPRKDMADLEERNAITKEVYTIFDARKEYFLTSTVVGGSYAIRIVSANPLAEEKYLRDMFKLLVKTTEDVLATRKAKLER